MESIHHNVSPRQRKPVDNSTYAGRFAERLKYLREKAGMSVDQLSEQTGVQRSKLYFWENGKHAAALNDDLLSIAKALGVSIRTLIPAE